MLMSMNANLTTPSSLTVSSFAFVHANIMGRISIKDINNNFVVDFLLLLSLILQNDAFLILRFPGQWLLSCFVQRIVHNTKPMQEYMMKDERKRICSGPSLAGTHPINEKTDAESH